jgi:hypothetical protein
MRRSIVPRCGIRSIAPLCETRSTIPLCGIRSITPRSGARSNRLRRSTLRLPRRQRTGHFLLPASWPMDLRKPMSLKYKGSRLFREFKSSWVMYLLLTPIFRLPTVSIREPRATLRNWLNSFLPRMLPSAMLSEIDVTDLLPCLTKSKRSSSGYLASRV